MQSTIDTQGQTLIPTKIRHLFNLTAGDQLEWLEENNTIRIIPIKTNSIDPFRGSGQGGSTERLLVDRAQNKERE